MRESTLSRFSIVLCSPKFAGNVGSAARAAANFGAGALVLVTPACDWSGQESRSRAVGNAISLLNEAKVTPSLKAALADSDFAMGFTRRSGKLRRPALFHELLPKFCGKKRVALVFGNEETGLTHDELQLCSAVAQISTDEALPSLNLSHAVAVVLSRLHEEFAENPGNQAKSSRASLREFESLLDHWREVLVAVGLTKAGNPDRMIGRIREILNRTEPMPQDVKLLRAFLSKTQRALRESSRNARK